MLPYTTATLRQEKKTRCRKGATRCGRPWPASTGGLPCASFDRGRRTRRRRRRRRRQISSATSTFTPGYSRKKHRVLVGEKILGSARCWDTISLSKFCFGYCASFDGYCVSFDGCCALASPSNVSVSCFVAQQKTRSVLIITRSGHTRVQLQQGKQHLKPPLPLDLSVVHE